MDDPAGSSDARFAPPSSLLRRGPRRQIHRCRVNRPRRFSTPHRAWLTPAHRVSPPVERRPRPPEPEAAPTQADRPAPRRDRDWPRRTPISRRCGKLKSSWKSLVGSTAGPDRARAKQEYGDLPLVDPGDYRTKFRPAGSSDRVSRIHPLRARREAPIPGPSAGCDSSEDILAD